MKAIKLIGDLIERLIGKDNNRFFALLLFTALMFALWLLYKQGAPSTPPARPDQQLRTG